MTATPRDPRVNPLFDDSRDGLAMFVIFTAAVLIVTSAVALIALVGGWWILGVAFAIHVLMTAIVVATIVSVMDGRSSATTEVQPLDDPGGGLGVLAALTTGSMFDQCSSAVSRSTALAKRPL